MMVYLRGADISEVDQELVRRDMTEMVLSAQARGEGLEDLIKGDYKAFCDEIIASLPKKTPKQKWIDALDITFMALAILTLLSKDFITMMGDVFAGRPNDPMMPITLGQALAIGFILLASLLIIRFITKTAFNIETTRHKVLLGLLAGLVFAGIFLLLISLNHIVLFSLHILVILGISLAFYLVHKVLERM